MPRDYIAQGSKTAGVSWIRYVILIGIIYILLVKLYFDKLHSNNLPVRQVGSKNS
jgi:hypothetical protein